MAKIIEDFEGDLSAWSFYNNGDLASDASRTITSSQSTSGSSSLRHDIGDEARPQSVSASGLGDYPDRGQDTYTYSRLSETGTSVRRFGIFCQAEASQPYSYLLNWYGGDNSLKLQKRDSGGKTTLASSSTGGGGSNNWMRMEFRTSSTSTVGEFNGEVLSSSDTTFSSGGVSLTNYTYSGPEDGWWDEVSIIGDPPAAPSNVSSAASGDDISVTWNDNSTEENGFHIDRHYDGSWTRAADVGANTTSYDDLSLLDGEEYRHRVRSYNGYGSSSWSYSNYTTTALPAPSGIGQTVNANDSIDVSWTDNSDNEDNFRVQVSRDGSNYQNPSGGPTTPGSNSTSANYNPNSDSAYQSQVGIDSSFEWRVRAETEDANSSWAYSGTGYTDPIPPHDPSVSRPGGDTFHIKGTVQSDFARYIRVEMREDTGAGYGAWSWFDTVTNTESQLISGSTNTKGSAFTIEYNVGTAYQAGAALQQDARYQFRIQSTWDSSVQSEYIYPDYGNSGNVYFQSSFEEHLSGYAGLPGDFAATGYAYDGNFGAVKEGNSHSAITRDDWTLDTTTTITTSHWANHEGSGTNRHGGAVLLDSNGAGYSAYYYAGQGELAIFAVSGGPLLSYGTKLTNATFTSPSAGWYEVELSLASNGDLTATLYDSSGASVASVGPFNDTSYSPSRPGIDSYHDQREADLLSASDGAGNSYSDSFEGPWTAITTTNTEYTYIGTSLTGYDNSGRIADSAPADGSWAIQLASGDSITKNLGDLSGASDVIVKAYVQAGSLDSASETVHVQWYDGGAWQNLHTLGHERNKQGWEEVTALVPSSYLSADNRLRFLGYGGPGDFMAVDRVVVSDVLHEYTTPAATSGLSLDATVEDEITASWTNNETFAADIAADVKRTSDTAYGTDAVLGTGATAHTYLGLDDGERYHIRPTPRVEQYRRGTLSTRHIAETVGAATALLPAPTTLAVDDVTGDQATVSWTPHHDYGDQRIEVKPTDAATWSDDSGALARSTTSYTTTALLDGEKYDLRVLAVTEHTTTEDI